MLKAIQLTYAELPAMGHGKPEKGIPSQHMSSRLLIRKKH